MTYGRVMYPLSGETNPELLGLPLIAQIWGRRSERSPSKRQARAREALTLGDSSGEPV